MYAQCPECLTVFSLEPETLAQARGEVTCGYCSGSFDALASLTSQLPAEPFERLPAKHETGEVPRLVLAIYRPPLDASAELVDVVTMDALASGGADAVAVAPAEQADPGAPDAPAEQATPRAHEAPTEAIDQPPPLPAASAIGTTAPQPTDEPAQPGADPFAPLAFSPRFARGRRARQASPAPPRRRAPASRRWPWIVVCLLLLLALGAQLGWAKRDALISDPQIGGWLRDACATLGCRLPLVRDVRQLQLVARDVRTRPGTTGALAISATVRNNAPFAQPWPVVALTLTDAHGKPVAMRRLRPSEYLGDRAVLRAGLAAGSSAALLLEVRDPGMAAVQFQLAFE